MPTVPTYDTPQAQAQGLPGVQLQGLSPRALAQGEIAGQTVERSGQNLMQMGANNIDADAKEQMMANQVRVDAALNNVKAAQQSLTYDPTQGYLGIKGQAAIQPNDSGQGLVDQYGQKLQDTINSASAGLANEAQRQVFARSAAGLSTQFNGQLQSHVLQEYKQFGLDTQKGTIDLASDAAQKAWNNPDTIDQNIASAKAAVWKTGQINGTPANLVEAQMQAVTSKIHAGVIEAALQNNNPQYANQYINQYKDQMDAHDLLKATGLVTSDMRGRLATSTAQNAINTYATAFTPDDTTRVQQITKQTESKGNVNAIGPYIEGQGTAKGSMQVMDGTNWKPGYGVTPAKDNSPEERARVGSDYIIALAKNYSGDMAKAWAAYNAGPSNVDKAIKDAGPNGNWLDALKTYQSPANHNQTVNYVAQNMNAYNKGGGAPALPSIHDIENNIRTQLGANPDPLTLKAALDEGKRQYTEMMSDRKTQGENAVQAAQQYLIQNNGDFNSMPETLKSAITQYAPDKYDDVQTYAGKIANPTKADNMAAYHTAIEHPDELAKMTDSEFNHFAMDNFTPATQKQIAKLRQDEASGKADASAGSINSKYMTSELNNRLTQIGIETKPKSAEDKARLGTIQKFISDGIFDQQQQLGRKMSQQEVSQYIDQSFLKNMQFKNTFLGMTLAGVKQLPYLQMTVGDMPGDQLDQIKAALARNGNTSPSNDQILRTYWAKRMKNNG